MGGNDAPVHEQQPVIEIVHVDKTSQGLRPHGIPIREPSGGDIKIPGLMP
jgi:hypothetical protein